jgi:hypothetical protein
MRRPCAPSCSRARRPTGLTRATTPLAGEDGVSNDPWCGGCGRGGGAGVRRQGAPGRPACHVRDSVGVREACTSHVAVALEARARPPPLAPRVSIAPLWLTMMWYLRLSCGCVCLRCTVPTGGVAEEVCVRGLWPGEGGRGVLPQLLSCSRVVWVGHVSRPPHPPPQPCLSTLRLGAHHVHHPLPPSGRCI